MTTPLIKLLNNSAIFLQSSATTCFIYGVHKSTSSFEFFSRLKNELHVGVFTIFNTLFSFYRICENFSFP